MLVPALIALAVVSALGSLFVIGSLIVSGRADDAAENLSSRIPYGDWPAVPTVDPPFHDGQS